MTLQELFSDESRWTQGSMARTKNKVATEIDSDTAYSFCLLGGVARCYPENGEDIKYKLYDVITDSGIISFNDRDETTFEDIRQVIEEANV